MKSKIFLFLFLICLVVFSQPAFAQTGVLQLSVSTSDVPVVLDTQSQYIVIRENSESPTAAYLVKLSGSLIYQRIPIGGSFSFASSTAYPFTSGTTVANIKLVSGGPVNFTVTESPSAPALVTLRNSGGSGGAVTSVAGRAGAVVLSSSDITGLAASATTNALNAANISSGTLPAARLPSPTISTLGGVDSKAATTHQFVTQIGTDGSVSSAQPSAADITGLAASATTDATNATNINSGTLPLAQLGNFNFGVFLRGPSGLGAAAATGAKGAITAYDMPPGYGQCSILDYAVCAATVDASGNPSFISQGSTGNRLTLNGANLILLIKGQYQTGTGTYTDAITGLASSTFNYLYAKQDVANANLVAADFATTTLAPVYSYLSPTACTSASSSAPQYWFDLGSRQWKVSTAAACSFSVASPQIVFLGVVWVTATPTISGIAHEPMTLSPYRRFELFGDGFDGQNSGTDIVKQEKTTGTTTIDNWHTYTSFQLTGATVSPTLRNSNGTTSGTLMVWSQNPVLVVNTSALSANGLGTAGPVGVTGTCTAGSPAGLGGAGGGSGGAGVTNAGCAGGNRASSFSFPTASGGGTAGTVAGAGGAASSAPSPFPICQSNFQISLIGGAGPAGGGDATHTSGSGGPSGGAILVHAPSIVVDSGSSFTANGSNGGNATANSGGGGGGGAGMVAACAGFNAIAGTMTATHGSGGTNGAGTGGAGGAGADGLVQKIKLW